MTIPQTIPPIAIVILCAAVAMILTLRHVSLDLVDHRTHGAAHAAEIAEAQFKCPEGVKQSHLTPDGKLICVFDTARTYGKANRRQFVAAN